MPKQREPLDGKLRELPGFDPEDPLFASPNRRTEQPTTLRLAQDQSTLGVGGRLTSDPSRRVMLREERSGPDRRFLWAYFDEDGALHIDGQDLGPATALVSADGEYEWFETIRPAHLPRLVELLGGEAGADLLDLLAERYTGAGAAELERILRESGIPVERFVY